MRFHCGLLLTTLLLSGCPYPHGQEPEWLKPKDTTKAAPVANFKSPVTAKVGQEVPVTVSVVINGSSCTTEVNSAISEADPANRVWHVTGTRKVAGGTCTADVTTRQTTATFTPKTPGTYTLKAPVHTWPLEDYSHLEPKIEASASPSTVVELTQTIVVTE